MTPTTLQALRRHLFFSVAEAAAHIGGMTPRSWQYLETGQRQIPADVIEKIRDLCEWREQYYRDAVAKIMREDVDPVLPWYASRDDWLSLVSMDRRDPAKWRPYCSVVAQLCAEMGAVVEN